MRFGRLLTVLGGMGLVASMPAVAQAVRSEVTAPNGVKVTVYSDDFAERYEYTAPKITFSGSSFALVAKVVQGGVAGETLVLGTIFYTDDWRYYQGAILRGGEKVDATFADRNVLSCSGSRFGGCSHSEGFQLTFTPDQISKYAMDGEIEVQLRAQRGDALMLSIPLKYFEAVEQAAGQK